MINLENRCAWKEVVEMQELAEGKMKDCKECKGYNTSCYAYYTLNEKQTKFRVYKTKKNEDLPLIKLYKKINSFKN